MRGIREAIADFCDSLSPWQLKYRIIEVKRYRELTKKMEKVYKIQARLKYTPFWFNYSDREFAYFCKAYTEMKKLRGIPKTEERVIPESECVLLLMGDEDDE